MNVYGVTCAFNTTQTLIDCAFKNEADANVYATELNSDKTKAVARCKEIITLREGEEMLKFLAEDGIITFAVMPVEMK